MKESTFIKKRHIKTTIKCVGIIKNDNITGVEYGLVEIPATAEIIVQSPKNKEKKLKKHNKKHNSVKNTRIKTDSVEKETKIASKKPKRRYHIHATIVCSYNFKTSKKPVDLTEKNFKKKKDLFKKKQRNKKYIIAPSFVSAEQFAEMLENHIISQWLNQKNR